MKDASFGQINTPNLNRYTNVNNTNDYQRKKNTNMDTIIYTMNNRLLLTIYIINI